MVPTLDLFSELSLLTMGPVRRPEGRHEAVHELANCFESVRTLFNGALLEFCRHVIDLALDFRPSFPLKHESLLRWTLPTIGFIFLQD